MKKRIALLCITLSVAFPCFARQTSGNRAQRHEELTDEQTITYSHSYEQLSSELLTIESSFFFRRTLSEDELSRLATIREKAQQSYAAVRPSRSLLTSGFQTVVRQANYLLINSPQ